MTDINAQLVQQITERVIAALNNGGTLVTPAQVRPPIGTCTAGDGSANTNATAPQNANATQNTNGGKVLAGFITARMLEDYGSKTVRIDINAKLTPLARDIIKDKGLTLVRIAPDAPANAATPAARFLWWIDGKCPTVDRVTQEQTDTMVASHRKHDAASLGDVIGDLARAVSSGDVNGGVLFVESAAAATVLANRCKSLRAVVGICDDATAAAIRDVAANVLIVEYRHQKGEAIVNMTRTFLTAPRPGAATIQRRIEEVQRCG